MKQKNRLPWALPFFSPPGFFSGGLNGANANEDNLSIKGTYVLEYRVLPDGKKID